ncbi:MAG TPA: hypothetical protein VIZ28_05910 [Chitinophagaceae bacterium]
MTEATDSTFLIMFLLIFVAIVVVLVLGMFLKGKNNDSKNADKIK